MLTIDPRLRNTSVYQKTLSLNDFYDKDPEAGYPLGNVQGLGRMTSPILKANMPLLPMPLARLIAAYAFGQFLQSEDLPNPDSRVMVRNGQITTHWERSNMQPHEALIARTWAVMKRAGFPVAVNPALTVSALSLRASGGVRASMRNTLQDHGIIQKRKMAGGKSR